MAFEKFLRIMLYLTLGFLWGGVLLLDQIITPIPKKILIPPFPGEKEGAPEKKGPEKPEKKQKPEPLFTLRMTERSYSKFSELAKELYSDSPKQKAFGELNGSLFAPSDPIQKGAIYLDLKNE